MGLKAYLRTKAFQAELEAFGVPSGYSGRVAAAVNKHLVEDFLMKPKPGWKTTEFWLSLFTAAAAGLGAVGGFLPPTIASIAGAVVTAGYSIARGLTKANPSAPSTDPPKGVD